MNSSLITRALPLVFLTTLSLSASVALAQEYIVPANTPAHIKRAVESESRSEQQVARDAGRLPAQVLTLADLNEGDHVAEISTFGQYYTPMLVEAVGSAGKVEMYDMPYLAAFSDGNVGKAGQAFADANENAEYHIVHYSDINFPAGLDAVYNVLYYHDLEGVDVDTAVMNRKVFSALKPGGICNC